MFRSNNKQGVLHFTCSVQVIHYHYYQPVSINTTHHSFSYSHSILINPTQLLTTNNNTIITTTTNKYNSLLLTHTSKKILPIIINQSHYQSINQSIN